MKQIGFHGNLGLLAPLELPNGRAVQAAADFEPRVARVEDHEHEAQQSLHHDRCHRPEIEHLRQKFVPTPKFAVSLPILRVSGRKRR